MTGGLAGNAYRLFKSFQRRECEMIQKRPVRPGAGDAGPVAGAYSPTATIASATRGISVSVNPARFIRLSPIT